MKPTIKQVEEALGVKAEDWDCVDPQELIDVIYRLSIELQASSSDSANICDMQHKKAATRSKYE